MKRLTKISLTVAILGIVLSLKGSSPFVAMAISPKSEQPTTESRRINPRRTAGHSLPTGGQQFAEDFAPKGIRPIPLLPPVFIVDRSRE